MYAFHATLWVSSPHLQKGPVVPLRGDRLATRMPDTSHDVDAFGITFEKAACEMEKLERMIVEPDGSFVYSGDDPARWQLEGNLFDRAGRLLNVQLWGNCPPATFDRLLNCFDWPATELVFECLREGVYLAEPEFRRFAKLAISDETS